MSPVRQPRAISHLLSCLALAAVSFAQPAPRTVALKTADGTALKATYFAAAHPGPGVILLHQINRTRKSWDDVAAQLAAGGIHTLTLDLRGHGDSGSTPWDQQPRAEQGKHWRGWPEDVDAAIDFLLSQPGVNRDLIGLGGAGLLGVDNGVEAARHHPGLIKSFVLMSGETFRDGLRFLHQSPQIPSLFVVSDDDEYPPTVEAMELLYVTSTNPAKKLIHYVSAEEAPWLWYEPVDVGKVPPNGAHGTDLFQKHPELPGLIVHWFETTLVKTPAHAPADSVAAAEILNQLQVPGGAADVTQRLLEARRNDPKAQLFPEITVNIIGADYQRVGDLKNALEVFKLNVLAYSDSADAQSSLADAYLALGEKDLARLAAEKALAILDTPGQPASSWADTEVFRAQQRKSAERVLEKLNAKGGAGQ